MWEVNRFCIMIDKGNLHTNGRIALAKEGPLQDGNKLVGVLEDPIMQGGGPTFWRLWATLKEELSWATH